MQAIAALCTGAYHMSKRTTQSVLEDLFGSFGTQSAEGSRIVEAMMTVVASLKQQHRHVLDYMTAACEAALCGEPAPSLLPTSADLEQLMLPAA